MLDPIPGIAHTSDMITIMRGERSEHPTPPFSYLDFADLRDQAHSFSGLLGYHDDYMAITGSGTPERIYGTLATANYFEVLGVRPIMGRSLLPSLATERTGAAEAVLSYDLWQNRFGGDPSVVGKTIQINLHPYTIVGVAPRGFQGCKTGLRSDIWIPLGMDKQVWDSNRINERDTLWLNVLGKLAPGVDHAQAESELNVLMQRLVARFPDQHLGPNKISSDPLWRSPFGANVYLYGTLPMLLALAGALLMLACANVANLLLVRSVGRRREMAIRLSMGASRWRVVRQLLVENLLIALAGGVVALTLTLWTASTLSAFLPSTDTLPLTLNGHVDLTVIVATLLVSAFTAVVAGAIPALRASRLSPVTVLKDEALSTSGGLSKSRLTGGLVIAQIALSLLLLTCAGLFVRSLQNAQNSDVGFDPNHVLLTTYDLDPVGYTGATGREFDRQLLARVRALPGVQSATLADFAPLNFTIHSDFVQPEGYVPRLHESMEIDRGLVGPGYLETLRTPLHCRARHFGPGYRGHAARRRRQPGPRRSLLAGTERNRQAYPGGGRLVHCGGRGGQWKVSPHDLRLCPFGPDAPDAALHQPGHPPRAGQRRPAVLCFCRRANGTRAQCGFAALQPDHFEGEHANGQRLRAHRRGFCRRLRFLALVLAAVGIYGVVAYTTRQRTHEIGIRMALGAAQGDVFRSVLGQGIRLALLGLAAGLAVSFAFTRFLRGLFSAWEPWTGSPLRWFPPFFPGRRWRRALCRRGARLRLIRCRRSGPNNRTAEKGKKEGRR